jgi:23S rRNA (adenine2503-C2)-methyltransferase
MAPAAPSRPALTGLSVTELRTLFASLGEPSFRAEQLFRAVWKEGKSIEEVTTLSKELRERLLAAVAPAATTVVEVEESTDGTTKWLLGLADGARVETVLIPDGERRTVCVSTQVGCPIRCVFCASGVAGLVRNLTVAEIAEQVLHVRRRLGARPTNVVVMGMGEPLANLAALAPAIRILEDPVGMDFGARRITVSTAGTAAMVDRLADEDLGVHLAVSLHGPDDPTRRRLIPTSPEGRVRDLVDAASRFARRTGRDVTVEYVLIEGENDRPEHADALAALVEGRHIHVNLIPLNPVSHRPDLRAPPVAAGQAFARRLEDAGVVTRLRSRRGDDIHAACGQLAMERAVAR